MYIVYNNKYGGNLATVGTNYIANNDGKLYIAINRRVFENDLSSIVQCITDIHNAILKRTIVPAASLATYGMNLGDNSSDITFVDGGLGQLLDLSVLFYKSNFDNFASITSAIDDIVVRLQEYYFTPVNYYLVVGNTATVIGSTDLTYWENAVAISGTIFSCTISNNGMFGICGDNGGTGTVYTSPNGTNWTSRSPGVGNFPLYGIAVNSAGFFVAVGSTGRAAYSPDGITWTNNNIGSVSLNAITVSRSGLFVTGGTNGVVYRSSDGLSWSSGTAGFDLINSIAVNNAGLFVLCNSGGDIFTSPDGGTWTSRTSPFSTALNTVGTDGSKFIISGASGNTATSPDGITWTSVNIGVTTTIRGATIDSDGNYILVGDGGLIRTSPDGITWTSRPSGFTQQLNEVFVLNSNNAYQ